VRDTYIAVFSYAGMSAEDAERNQRLFARAVMRELQRLGEDTQAATATAHR